MIMVFDVYALKNGRFVGCDEWGCYRCELFNEEIYREDDGFLLKHDRCPAFKK